GGRAMGSQPLAARSSCPALRGGDTARHHGTRTAPARRTRACHTRGDTVVAVRLPHRGWVFDLDGTVYLGEALIPGAAETLAELRAHGFGVSAERRVRWVVIGCDRTFDDAKLNTARQAARQGARLIATSPDRTCPVEGGEMPDCAGMAGAVEAVTCTTGEV